MDLRIGLQTELGEYPLGVFFDRALGHDQFAGDPGIGVSLGHEFQNLTFALGQSLDRGIAALLAEDLLDDLRVDRETAVGYAMYGIKEVVDIADTILEQIADRAAASGQEFLGVRQHNVLAQQQNGRLGPHAPQSDSGAEAFVRVTRWHADVDDGEVGTSSQRLGVQGLAVTDSGHHLVAGVGEDESQSLTKQD